MPYYTVEQVRSKSGEIQASEGRRKNHRVRIDYINAGSPLTLTYIDDNNAILRTSAVESVEEVDGVLTVTTGNSVYGFRKITKEDD